MLFEPKYTCKVYGVLDGVSRIKAILAYAEFTGMNSLQAKYLLANSPQLLAEIGCETFRSVVLNQTERAKVEAALGAYLKLEFTEAEVNVLPFGALAGPGPWET